MHWHDDWRRHGDVVVWCLDDSRREPSKKTESSSWWKRQKHGQAPMIEEVEDGIQDSGLGERWRQKLLCSSAKKSKNGLDREVALERAVEKPFWKVKTPRDDNEEAEKRRNLKASGGGTTYYNVEILAE